MNKTLMYSKLRIGASTLAVLALSIFGTAQAAKNDEAAQIEKQKIAVSVEDLSGYMDFRTEHIREDLLHSAFHRAAKRKDWFGDYVFNYNGTRPTSDVGTVSFDIISWERRPTGFYECTVRAVYTDADGNDTNLGVFHGMKMSMGINTAFSVNDDFRDAAQDAFTQALRKLGKEKLAA